MWITFAVWLALLDDNAVLVANMQQLEPSLDVETALAHIHAAREAGKEAGIEPELLLAVAFVESHYDPAYTSRVEPEGRKTGLWRSRRAAGEGPRFCGVMQTKAGHDWKACLAQRDLITGYRTGAQELSWWLRRTRGDVTLALNGHACGAYGLTNPCRYYGARVLARQRRLAQGARRHSIRLSSGV